MIYDPILTIGCDGKDCFRNLEIEMENWSDTVEDSWGVRDIVKQIEDAGWLEISTEEHYCPECQENNKMG